MASQEPADEHGNTETEEGTIAIQKKRARRVSFAENTSVHFFDRDEEFETPPDFAKPSSFSELGQSGEDLGFFGVAGEANDSKESSQNEEEEDCEEDMDELDSRSPFLRPMGSPSPGSTFGSATSNDEDNFFGPVSSRFIRPSRLSDSAASDENHDLTMDSTAFSMHFRSIARSDSEGELKTSTRLHLNFEDKTPSSDSIPSNTGSSMVLTEAKKPSSQSSVHIAKLRDGCDSNDMSLVGEYLHRYDYGRLSPRLDALLAEGSKELHVISTSNNSIDLEQPQNREMKLSPPKENGVLVDLSDNQMKETEEISTHGMVNEAVSFVQNELGDADGGFKTSPSHAFNFSSNTSKVLVLNNSSPNNSMGAFDGKTNELVKDASALRSDLDFLTVGSNALSNPDNVAPQVDNFAAQENHSPLPVSTSSFSAKQRRILLNIYSPSKSQWNVTPEKETSSFIRTENIRHGESTSSIQKSISVLRRLEASPFSSALNAKIGDSCLRSSVNLSKMTPLGTLLEKNNRGHQVNDAGYNGIEIHTLDMYSGEKLSAVDQKRREKEGLINMDDSRIETPKRNKVASLLDLPSQFTWSDEKLQSNFLTSEDPTEGKFVNANNKAIATSQRLISSSLKGLEMLKSPKYQSSLLRDRRLPNGHIVAVEDADSRNNVINNSSAADTIHEVQDKSGIMWSKENSMKDKESQNQSESTNRDLQPGRVLSRFGIEFLDVGIKAASLILNGTADKPSFQKNLVDQFCQSSSREVLFSDNVHDLPVDDVLTPGPNLLAKGSVNSSERKRRNEDTTFGNRDHIEEIFGIERTPKLQKGGVSLECIGNRGSGPSMNGDKLKHLGEISKKFLEDTKLLLSVSVDKLSLQAIDLLEDRLGQLHRSKTYDMLCAEIQSQKGYDQSINVLHQREAETRFLFHRIVHDQAKLQLMRVKRDRLLKRVQLVHSGIQESEVLKSTCLPRKCGDVQVEDDRSESFTGNIKQNKEVSCDKLTAGRLASEESERRIFELTKALQTSFKMKGELSSAETIALVNNHLIKRACLRLVRMESQLWGVDNLESKNGHHIVVLNYLDLIIQRLTITVDPVSNISISNKLNETNIIKKFADMDADTAFRFVFDAETTRKYVGAPNLAQETQMSSSLLGNLLDVIQEIQLARIELRNLMRTSFCSPSVEHLYLQLCFFDYRHGKKTTLTLDMSCLKRGVYPLEILPCESVVRVNGAKNFPTQSLLPEITAAVQNLRIGYTRIVRLCRCISHWVNS